MTDADRREPYRREILAVLPRVLALFDSNPVSPTHGYADRLYWSWTLIDYPNATPQGLVHGLAALVSRDMLPWGIRPDSIVRRIDEAIAAVARQTARDGSLVETFPNEKSFCVTALIAYDILAAADLLRDRVDETTIRTWRSVAEPLISFLKHNEETHGVISNHLATAAAALFRAAEFGDADSERRGQQILNRILAHQSEEGWFSEYGGADPGYETLDWSYLADVYRRRPSEALRKALERSLAFAGHAAHPDGSFGGFYGSRNTRFIYPAGLEILAADFPAAASLAAFARESIENRSVPVLSTMDDSNLAPMFNAYCRALCAEPGRQDANRELPFQSREVWRKVFPAAGMVVDNGPGHYTVISTLKGGVVHHFEKGSSRAATVDAGVAVAGSGKVYTTQAANPDNRVDLRDDHLVVECRFAATNLEQQTPLKMIVLRLLALTVFRSRPVLEFIKRLLVKRLMTRTSTIALKNRRKIVFGPALEISDEIVGQAAGLERLAHKQFQSIHMASAGYWQVSDDQP